MNKILPSPSSSVVTQTEAPVIAAETPVAPRSVMPDVQVVRGDRLPRTTVEPRSAVDPRSALAPTSASGVAPQPAGPAPTRSAPNVLDSLGALTRNAPNITHASAKKRIMAAYGGLDLLVRRYAPAEGERYDRLLHDTLTTNDLAQVGAYEEPLREMKARLLTAARDDIRQAEARARSSGQPFDRLAYLQAQGLVAPNWRMTGEGRAVRDSEPPRDRPATTYTERVPFKEEFDLTSRLLNVHLTEAEHRAGLYQVRAPIEAELILDTRWPVGAVDRNTQQAVVMRGEDYGSDRELKSAQMRRAERTATLTIATNEESRLTTAITSGTAQLEALRTRAEQAQTAMTDATTTATRAATQVEQATQTATSANAAAATAESARASAAAKMANDLLRLDRGIDLSIEFALGSDELRPESRAQLDALRSVLGSDTFKGLPILVDGHTDAQGSAESNQVLSEKRANAVAAYLASEHSVPREMLTARGMGERELKDAANPSSGVNRRVQISIAISPERRAELQAKATEAQLVVDQRAAALTQQSVDAATNAVAAADTYTQSLAAVEEARRAYDEARTAYEAAATLLQTNRDALPAAQSAVATARTALTSAQQAEDAATPRAEGALFVSDFRGNHIEWLEGTPEKLPERMAQALTEGFAQSGAEGATVRSVLSGVNPATGRSLALDLAAVLSENEAAKGAGTVIGERVSDFMERGFFDLGKGRDLRWVTVNSYSGSGNYLTATQGVGAAVVPPKETVIMVDLVPPPPAVVAPQAAPQTAASTGVTTTDDATPPAPSANAPSSATPSASQTLPSLPEVPPVLQSSVATDAANALLERARKRAEDSQRALDERLAGLEAQRASAAAIRSDAANSARSPRIDLALAFGLDSYVITDTAPLRQLGAELSREAYKGRRIFIHGHTDNSGSAAHNLELSRRRAQAVRDHLVTSFGIPPEVLVIEGYGASRLKNPRDPMAAENRRVEITVGAENIRGN